MLKKIKHFLRFCIKQALIYALAFIRKYPAIKTPLVFILKPFPRLSIRLNQFSINNGGRSFAQKKRPAKLPLTLPLNLASTIFVDKKESRLVSESLGLGGRVIYFYIDHAVSSEANTGVQKVSRALAAALKNCGEKIIFIKWCPFNKDLVLVNQLDLIHFARWSGPVFSDVEKEFYPKDDETKILLSKHDLTQGNYCLVPEVTHINAYGKDLTSEIIVSAKGKGLTCCFIFYDAIPIFRPEMGEFSLNHAHYMRSLQLVDMIVPISNWSKNCLINFLVEKEFVPHSQLPLIKNISLPPIELGDGRPDNATETSTTILSIGSITPHKNQLALARAFELFIQKNKQGEWRLELAGHIHPEVANELSSICSRVPEISFLEYISDDELANKISKCAFTVFPSLMEGFGLPILESLWWGKPCICANFGAMVEVANGGGCLMVDVSSSEEILGAIEALIEDSGLLNKLSEEARAREILSWDEYAMNFSNCLDEPFDFAAKLAPIYFLVDHTSSYPGNTGIQRVVRMMADSLMNAGVKLIPVVWDKSKASIMPASHSELLHMELWNGPFANLWSEWVEVECNPFGWILVAELLIDPSGPTAKDMYQFARQKKLRCAAVFYDAIPWKMKDVYSQFEINRHAEMMLDLNGFNLILAISNFSRSDLIRYLSAQVSEGTPRLQERIIACELPGEFKGSKRNVTKSAAGALEEISILCVSTIEPRKNHLALLRAFELLQNKNPDRKIILTFVGGAPFPELAEKIEEIGKSISGFRWLKKVDDEALDILYQDSDFTVYPSIEEGFGLPILESIWYGRPCICSNAGAMLEVAQGGGCLLVDVHSPEKIMLAMDRLMNDKNYLESMSIEASNRRLRTWKEYARDIIFYLANERPSRPLNIDSTTSVKHQVTELPHLQSRIPLLSICISTYNRAKWLSASLKNVFEFLNISDDDIEILVCDNASEDNTSEIIKPYLGRKGFRYEQNLINVGMLGNLRVTAHHARGKYIWILGDDDLIKPGSVEKIMEVLRGSKDLSLIYFNYDFTLNENADDALNNIEQFFADSSPVAPVSSNFYGPISEIAGCSENMFTAIYCLIFRRDHAIKAYSQFTGGRPFSTMLTCIPTTSYVLNHMTNESGYWIGEPLIVVNLNVSWMKYASIWLLERLPEAFDLAEKMGVNAEKMDEFRVQHLQHITHWVNDIYTNQENQNYQYFSMMRLIERFKHLEGFREIVPDLRTIYSMANAKGFRGAETPTDEIFSIFQQEGLIK